MEVRKVQNIVEIWKGYDNETIGASFRKHGTVNLFNN
jgi:hypothetical protein